MPDGTYLSSPQSIGRNSSRTSPSPSRPPKLSALSPLQTFSPLQPVRTAPSALDSPPSGTGSAASGGGRSRAGSVTRSLSRRDSVLVQAAKWGTGDGFYDDDQASPRELFSRLTLVKAPAEKPGIGRHSRSKSSSSLAPFSSFASATDTPATSARGPRRSFAASSFGGFSPLQAIKSPTAADQPPSLHRVHSHHDDSAVGIQRKVLSPDEVVQIARELNTPVLMPHGGFNGAELKRRKSAGSVFSRSVGAASFGSSFGGGGGESLGLSGSIDRSPERPPVALEPVEYVQMDDDILLPFVDRCDEVLELMAHPANAKLFKLLRAAFPKEPARDDVWRDLPPEQWRWEELVQHLTKVPRTECPDYEWVFAARRAVRQRSVALWEKLGVCLGCDEGLLNAGIEDDSPPSWGGLGLVEDDDNDDGAGYEPMKPQVWIAGLEAVDPDELARAENQFMDEFGEIVEDEGEQAAAGMSALLTIGEGEEPSAPHAVAPGASGKTLPMSMPRQTTAQRAGNRNNIDPILGLLDPSAESSPPRIATHTHRTSVSAARRLSPPATGLREARAKSFVGLQICTSPSLPSLADHSGSFTRSAGAADSAGGAGAPAALPVYERGPGSPMFPSSFSSLSVQPNLGRRASGAGGGGRPPQVQDEFRTFQGRAGLMRKPSGTGLSESAITFVSESDYSGGHY